MRLESVNCKQQFTDYICAGVLNDPFSPLAAPPCQGVYTELAKAGWTLDFSGNVTNNVWKSTAEVPVTPGQGVNVQWAPIVTGAAIDTTLTRTGNADIESNWEEVT